MTLRTRIALSIIALGVLAAILIDALRGPAPRPGLWGGPEELWQTILILGIIAMIVLNWAIRGWPRK